MVGLDNNLEASRNGLPQSTPFVSFYKLSFLNVNLLYCNSVMVVEVWNPKRQKMVVEEVDGYIVFRLSVQFLFIFFNDIL
jgi:hypothetical protein